MPCDRLRTTRKEVEMTVRARHGPPRNGVLWKQRSAALALFLGANLLIGVVRPAGALAGPLDTQPIHVRMEAVILSEGDGGIPAVAFRQDDGLHPHVDGLRIEGTGECARGSDNPDEQVSTQEERECCRALLPQDTVTRRSVPRPHRHFDFLSCRPEPVAGHPRAAATCGSPREVASPPPA